MSNSTNTNTNTNTNNNAPAKTKRDFQFSAAWLSWEKHPRTRNIASHIGAHLEEIVTNKKGALRYISLSLRTISRLASLHPRVLIVQNPSMILTGLAIFMRWAFRYRLVVDAHNEAVEPYIHQTKTVLWLSNLFLKTADLTIVTNTPLAEVVRKAGGKPFVLPDKVPEYHGNISSTDSEIITVVLISTYAKDEPIEEFLEAAGDLEGQMTLYVTGTAEKLSAQVRTQVSNNVHFTGFLNEKDYWELLASADAIADLTRMDNCLVCGAYEGIAVGKPLILSNNEATRNYFNKGALYVDNSVSEIKGALSTLQEKRIELQQQSIKMREELRASWSNNVKNFILTLHELAES